MIETVLAIICVSSWFIVYKFTRSWIFTIITFFVSIQLSTYIIDQYREQRLQNAMHSDNQKSVCGTYLGMSLVQRGSKNNKWEQTVFHFQSTDGKKHTFPESDLLTLMGEHRKFLEHPPKPMCLKYAPDYIDRYGYYFLTDITFHPK